MTYIERAAVLERLTNLGNHIEQLSRGSEDAKAIRAAISEITRMDREIRHLHTQIATEAAA